MDAILQEPLNRGRFEIWTKKPSFEFMEVHQVHGTDIVSLETLPTEADGMVVSWNELEKPLLIKTADCLPIVIEGNDGVVFLHAGWRGLAGGILRKPEIALIKPLRAYIGPSIHECCFEVSEDFQENFPGSAHFTRSQGKYHFNLQARAKEELKELFPGLLVGVSPVCTSCNSNYHSYRRDKNKDRNWNLYIKG